MEISGTTEDYTVDVKENQIIKDLGQVIKQNIKKSPKEEETIELDLDDQENTIDFD